MTIKNKRPGATSLKSDKQMEIDVSSSECKLTKGLVMSNGEYEAEEPTAQSDDVDMEDI